MKRNIQIKISYSSLKFEYVFMFENDDDLQFKPRIKCTKFHSHKYVKIL